MQKALCNEGSGWLFSPGPDLRPDRPLLLNMRYSSAGFLSNSVTCDSYVRLDRCPE